MSQIILIDQFLDEPSSVTKQQLIDNQALSIPTTDTSSPEFYATVANDIAVGYYPEEEHDTLVQVSYWTSLYYGALEVQ